MPSSNELFAQAVRAYKEGNLPEAERCCREVLRIEPEKAEAWNLLGAFYKRAGRSADAKHCFEEALRLDPGNPPYHNNLGEVYRNEGELGKAEECYRKAIELEPKYAIAHNNLALVLQARYRLAEAADHLTTAIGLRPGYAMAHYNLGNVRKDQEKLREAIECYREALKLNPKYVAAHNGLGVTLQSLHKYEEAVASFERAIELDPSYAKAHNNLGNGLQEMEKLDAAIASYKEAIRINPDYVEAYTNLATALEKKRHLDAAEKALRKALAFNPNYPDAHYNLGHVLAGKEDFEGAMASFRQALALRPEFHHALINLEETRAKVCDWERREEEIRRVVEIVRGYLAKGETSPLPPFSAIGFTQGAAFQLAVAKQWSKTLEERGLWARERAQESSRYRPAAEEGKRRIKIAYLSGDFRNHAVSHLVRPLFGLHDRAQFAVYAFSYGPDDGSGYRKTIAETSDHFVDLAGRSTMDCARSVRGAAIDILIDLGGYTAGSRPEILAERPAPVQMSYLYPATMGADFVGYLVTDRVVASHEVRTQMHEKTVTLPHCHLITDDTQTIARSEPSRAEEGLPPDGFVFCSFTGGRKIDPVIFASWMRILSKVPESILWLKVSRPEAATRLRREAVKRGVAEERLVFAKFAEEKSRHLARQGLADLFLDTRIYGAHTTAIDALWAGVPVLTCPGATPASRIGASILTAIEMPELIMPDLETYEETAIRLATNPEELQRVNDKLARNRSTTPLFDTPRWTRNWEKALRMIWERCERGEGPGEIVVEESSYASSFGKTSENAKASEDV